MKKRAVISLSGGMDSSTLLLRCLHEYDKVTAISFDYGQKHKVEESIPPDKDTTTFFAMINN